MTIKDIRVLKNGSLTTDQRGARPNQLKKNSPRDLGAAFTSRFTAHFKKHGIKAIEEVFENHPVEYLKIATRLLPKDINLNIEHTFSDVLQEAHKKISIRLEEEQVIEGEIIEKETDS